MRDAGSVAVPAVNVTFQAPAPGPSGTFGSPCSGTTCVVATNSLGVATAPTFTANGTMGSYTVTGSVTGLTPASFALSNSCPPLTITSLTANPSVLWPPNHQMVAVTLSDTTSGGCPVVACHISSISSSQPVDPGGDWTITGDLTLALRADRLTSHGASEDGRIYTITVECTGGSSSTSKSTTVVVPHDQGH